MRDRHNALARYRPRQAMQSHNRAPVPVGICHVLRSLLRCCLCVQEALRVLKPGRPLIFLERSEPTHTQQHTHHPG